MGGADAAGCPAPSRGPIPAVARPVHGAQRTHVPGVLAGLDGDALDSAICGYAADVVRGDAPTPLIGAVDDEPTEREQRRAATRAVTHPAPAGLLPAAAIDGKLLHGSRTPTGQVFLVAAVTHHSAVILGQRQVPGQDAVKAR